MKKLVFVAAAALVGACFADASIASANIVGYMQKDQPLGKNWIVSTFLEVGKDKADCTLGAIKPNDQFVPGEDYVQFFNGQGGSAGRYTYFTEAPKVGYPNGWYDYADIQKDVLTPSNDVKLPFGTMIMLYSVSSADIANTYSGEVVQNKTTFDLPMGKSWLGNATPVDKKLQDFEPSANFVPGDDYIQFFNEQGGSAGRYTYFATAPTTGYSAGWYDHDDLQKDILTPANDKVIPAGTGFMIYAVTSDQIQFEIPAAL